MTFVFEARRLPFASVSETYATRLQPLLALHALEGLPLWDRCMLAAVLPVVQQRHADVQPAREEDVAIALSIVRGLDELEVVFDSIVSTRAELHEQRQPLTSEASADARRRSQPPKTSEEILLEQLLQERFSDTAPYLRESSSSNSSSSGSGGAETEEPGEEEEEAGTVVDVAMCFTAAGESLGIGSANVFGGHGYHP
ncbi:hypothetical protein NESM_000641800 [Novymonas esmeraldas]|uniref:Uncharacterized protein n=1 Tax=Novymonas esmeraldas TaxID=1808958 RepID=A0AAW0EU80_9TRYP